MNAWFPIMGKTNARVLFVDGFAGPGEYADGEKGSPVVAMRVFARHPERAKKKAEVVFYFIEKDPARFEHLDKLVEKWRPLLAPDAKAWAKRGSFDASMSDVFDDLDEQGNRMAPALVMIDPFGVKGMPMKVIRRILANPKCEVYVSFMWEAMNRFVSEPGFEASLDELFATSEWRRAKRNWLGMSGRTSYTDCTGGD